MDHLEGPFYMTSSSFLPKITESWHTSSSSISQLARWQAAVGVLKQMCQARLRNGYADGHHVTGQQGSSWMSMVSFPFLPCKMARGHGSTNGSSSHVELATRVAWMAWFGLKMSHLVFSASRSGWSTPNCLTFLTELNTPIDQHLMIY